MYYPNSCSVKNVHPLLGPYYGPQKQAGDLTVGGVITKLRTKFTLLDINTNRIRTVRTEDNIVIVASSVNEDRERSICRRFQQLGVRYSTTWTILCHAKLDHTNGPFETETRSTFT